MTAPTVTRRLRTLNQHGIHTDKQLQQLITASRVVKQPLEIAITCALLASCKSRAMFFDHSPRIERAIVSAGVRYATLTQQPSQESDKKS